MLKRTLSLCMAILLTVCTGSCFLYPIYINYLKNKFSYSVIEINLFSSFLNFGFWACILMSLLYNIIGTKASTAISLILLPGVFFVIYIISDSNLDYVGIYWLMILGFLLGEGSGLLYINILNTSIKNFYKSCTTNIINLISSTIAISPCIFYSYSDMFTNGLSVNDFLFLVLFIITIVILFGMCLFDYNEPTIADEFDAKMFKLNKQTFIVKIFSYVNLYSLIIFLLLVVINSIFSISLPHYLIFPIAHVLYIIIVVLEGFKVFDKYIIQEIERTHGHFSENDYGKEIVIQNAFDTNDPKIVQIEINNNNENNNIEYNKVNNTNETIEFNNVNNDHNKNNENENSKENESTGKNEDNEKSEDNGKNENEKNNNKVENEDKENIDNENNEDSENENNNNENIDNENKKDNKNGNNGDNKEEDNINGSNNNNENNNKNNNEKNNESNDDVKNDIIENNINSSNDIKRDSNISDNNRDSNAKINDENKNRDSNVSDNNRDSNIKINDENKNRDSNISDNNRDSNINNRYNYLNINDNRDSNINNNQEIRESITSVQFENNKTNNCINQSQNIRESINYKNNQIQSDLVRQRQEKIIAKVNDSNNFIPETSINSLINFPKSTRSTHNTEMNSFVEYINQNNEVIEDDPYRDQYEVLKQIIHDKMIILFFALLLFTMGCMVSNLNNIKFIILSINSSSKYLDEFILLYFSFNSLSRIITSYLLKGILHSKILFMFLLVIILIGLLSQIFGMFMVEGLFYLVMILAGIVHGTLMTFITLYIRSFYDLRDFGTILSFLTTGSGLGSLIFSALIFPIFYCFYQGNNLYCGGARCFVGSFLFNCIFMIIASIICFVMYRTDKTKKETEEVIRMNMYRNQAYCNMNASFN